MVLFSEIPKLTRHVDATLPYWRNVYHCLKHRNINQVSNVPHRLQTYRCHKHTAVINIERASRSGMSLSVHLGSYYLAEQCMYVIMSGRYCDKINIKHDHGTPRERYHIYWVRLHISPVELLVTKTVGVHKLLTREVKTQIKWLF